MPPLSRYNEVDGYSVCAYLTQYGGYGGLACTQEEVVLGIRTQLPFFGWYIHSKPVPSRPQYMAGYMCRGDHVNLTTMYNLMAQNIDRNFQFYKLHYESMSLCPCTDLCCDIKRWLNSSNDFLFTLVSLNPYFPSLSPPSPFLLCTRLNPPLGFGHKLNEKKGKEVFFSLSALLLAFTHIKRKESAVWFGRYWAHLLQISAISKGVRENGTCVGGRGYSKAALKS